MDDEKFLKHQTRGTLNLSYNGSNNQSFSFGSMLTSFKFAKGQTNSMIDNEDELDNLLDKLDCTSKEASNAELLRPSPRSSIVRIKLF